MRYRLTPVKTITKTGGGATARLRNNGVNEVNVTRDGYTSRDTWQWSLYFNDSWKKGRATINWGLRWDRQDDKALPTEIDANQLLPDLLPALDFAAPMPASSSTTSLRGLALPTSVGDAQTVLKASAGRYYGAGLAISNVLSPTGQTTLCTTGMT